MRHKHARITHLKEQSLQNKMASKFLMMEQKLRHTENILVNNHTFEIKKNYVNRTKTIIVRLLAKGITNETC